MPTTKVRQRRTPEAARAVILAAAEQLLADGGVEAVQVRAVARRTDMTDAGITHHFRDREGLLTALIEDAGQRMRSTINANIEEWLAGDADLRQLLMGLARLYRKGYAELGVALHGAGWRDRGEPIFGKVVDVIHAARLAQANDPAPDIMDTRLAVAAFHNAIATDALFGQEFRRSTGIKATAAKGSEQQLEWWIRTLQTALGLRATTPTAP
jgi:AcrR family transcriptional regulator